MTKSFLFILFLLFTSIGFTQVNDAGLWTELSIEKEFNQSFSIEYSNSERLYENISELESVINGISLRYRLDRKSKFAFTYRMSMKRQLNNMYVPYSRFSLDYTRRINASDFDIDLRLRYQTRQENELLYDYDSESRNTFRPRIKIRYKIQKYVPYIYIESFHPILYEEYQPLSKLRASAGVDYDFNNNHSVGVSYMVQRQFYETNPDTDFVLKLGYKFSF